MKVFLQFVWLSLFIFIAASVTYWLRGAPKRLYHCEAKDLKPHEICLKTALDFPSVLWIDARHRVDWQRDGHPDSMIFSLDNQENSNLLEAEITSKAFQQNPPPTLVVYCGDEHCGLSQQVANRLRGLNLGLTIYTLKGGWRVLSENQLTRNTSPKKNH